MAVAALKHGGESAGLKEALTTAQRQVLKEKEGEDELLSETGFELADMAVEEIEEVVTAPPKKVRVQSRLTPSTLTPGPGPVLSDARLSSKDSVRR